MDTKSRPAPRLVCLLFGLALVLASLLAIFGQEARPASPGAAAAKPFDYFRNSWSVIGLPDYMRGTRITPDNQLLLAGTDRVAIEYGTPLAALGRETKTLVDGWLPIIRVRTSSGSVKYEFLIWAAPLPDSRDAARAFNGPVDGENYLNWILVRAENTGRTPAKAALRIRYWRAEKEYAAVAEAPEAGAAAKTAAPLGLHEWAPILAPGEAREDFAAYPFSPLVGPSPRGDFRSENARAWLDRTVAFWKAKIGAAARISVPEPKATGALLASTVCQLLAMDKGELHAGEGLYDVFYIRDGAYQIQALEEAGLAAEAKAAIEPFLKNQRPDGRFETQKGQFDANGQAVWALWQYAGITGDSAWLGHAYPQMKKAVEWIIGARAKTASDPSFPGLLPAAPADGEYLWEGKNHIVGYDLWNLRAVLCAADAARRLGKIDDAQAFDREAKSYRASIDAAWKKTALPYFPPSWEKAGTHWGNTEILWPTRVLAPDDPRIGALSRHVRQEYAGGYKEGVIRWVAPKVRPAIHPYMGAYTAMNDLERGRDEDVVKDFYAYLLHSTATHAFPEGVHFEDREAWGETIPHATGASNYALLLRHMLIHEVGDLGAAGELHLLSAVPDWWLENGREIVVERAPTRFGEMGLRILGTPTGVKVEIKLPSRAKPAKIVLHLPKSRPLVGTVPGVEVVFRPDQTRRLDFEMTVKEYEKTAPKL